MLYLQLPYIYSGWCKFSYELPIYIRTAQHSDVDIIVHINFRMMLFNTKYTKFSTIRKLPAIRYMQCNCWLLILVITEIIILHKSYRIAGNVHAVLIVPRAARAARQREIKTGRNSHAPVFTCKACWWVWVWFFIVLHPRKYLLRALELFCVN